MFHLEKIRAAKMIVRSSKQTMAAFLIRRSLPLMLRSDFLLFTINADVNRERAFSFVQARSRFPLVLLNLSVAMLFIVLNNAARLFVNVQKPEV
jgi:hypothetical protein